MRVRIQKYPIYILNIWQHLEQYLTAYLVKDIHQGNAVMRRTKRMRYVLQIWSFIESLYIPHILNKNKKTKYYQIRN